MARDNDHTQDRNRDDLQSVKRNQRAYPGELLSAVSVDKQIRKLAIILKQEFNNTEDYQWVYLPGSGTELDSIEALLNWLTERYLYVNALSPRVQYKTLFQEFRRHLQNSMQGNNLRQIDI